MHTHESNRLVYMRPKKTTPAIALMFSTLALVLTACTGEETTAPLAPSPAALQIADPGLIRDGDVRTLQAEVRDQRNRILPGVPVQWTTTDPTVAFVTPAGLLTALREGTTEIVATTATLQRRRVLQVVLHPAMSIEIGTQQLVLPLGTRGSVPATLRGVDGRALLNRPLQVTSADPSIVQTTTSGELVPLKPGVTMITVRYGTLTASVAARVPGEVGALVYTVRTLHGSPLPAILDQRERQEGSVIIREITRLESGTVALGETYDVTLRLAHYEQSELNGNTIERLMGRQTVRDFGRVTYNWITGAAALESTYIGGLAHTLDWFNAAPRVSFRHAGTPETWMLGLRNP
jgi:Bacterial Ig-like domain (group 2)